MHKRRLGLFLVLAMLFGLRADAAPPDVDQLLAIGRSQLEVVQQLSMDFEATYGIEPIMWPPKSFVSLSVIYYKNPYKVKLNGVLADTIINRYVLPDGEGAAMYLQNKGKWYKEPAESAEAALQMRGSMSPTSWAAYIGYLENPHLADDTQLYEGREVYTITSALNGDGLLANAATYGLSSGEEAETLLRENNPLCPFTVWIDVQNGNIVKMEMDLSPFVSLVVTAEGLEGAQAAHMIIQGNFHEIDPSDDFEIPAEILAM